MECPRPPPSGAACWLRWTVPTPWPCRCPGSAAPARPVSERRWRSTPAGWWHGSSAWTGRSIWSGTTGAAGSWSGWSQPDPSWSGPGSPMPREIGDVEFEWHDFAKIWQTPQAGEDFWDQQLAAPAEERAGVFEMFGVPGEPALDLASHLSRTMADCILDLYRSAVDVGRQWGPDFAAIPAPGLVIIPSEEPFMRAVSSTRAAPGPAPARPLSTGSATGGCSRTRPGRRPSCANSGPPWPDSARPEADWYASGDRCEGRGG